MLQFAICDETKAKADPAALASICSALNLDTAGFAEAWGVSWAVAVGTDAASARAAGQVPVRLVDAAPEAPDALGYHDERQGMPDIVIAVGAITNAGGRVLVDGQAGVSWASTIAHEIYEAICNPAANRWASLVDGSLLVAFEVCDPVEGMSMQVRAADGVAVSLANFVLPSYFDPQATGPFDAMGVLTAPLSIASGGYQVQLDPSSNTVQDVFGAQVSSYDLGKVVNRNNRSSRVQRVHGDRRAGVRLVTESTLPAGGFVSRE